MFAGIGGFRAGLDRAGGFQCIGHCEIDKYADASYRAIGHNFSISIHAPAKGATDNPAAAIQPDCISIHAPAKGAT